MIYTGDCVDYMRSLSECSVDAVVTDPPYHLKANKRDDPRRASPDKNQRSKGFMNLAWDGGDVAFRTETWAEVLRVAKPGTHLVAFGGTRTFMPGLCGVAKPANPASMAEAVPHDFFTVRRRAAQSEIGGSMDCPVQRCAGATAIKAQVRSKRTAPSVWRRTITRPLNLLHSCAGSVG